MTATLGQIESCKTLQELFDLEDTWTQNSYAKDSLGNTSLVRSPRATCFCLVGGVMRVYPESERLSVLKKIHNKLDPSDSHTIAFSITKFNDSDTTTIDQIRSLVKEVGV